MGKNIYLTDEEYLNLLIRAREHLNTVKKVSLDDSTMVGFKHTESNVGLCNKDLTIEEIALWPEQFPARKVMKYQEKGQKCPLDSRKGFLGTPDGCFYKCMIFRRGLENIEKIKKLYDERIDAFKRYLSRQEEVKT